MKRTELARILGKHGSLEDRITVQGAEYAVYAVAQSDPGESNAVLFDIPPGVSTEFEEIVQPIHLRILTLNGIGRVLLHDRIRGESSQRGLSVAEEPVPIGQHQVYSYQSKNGLVLLDTCTPPFQDGDELVPDLASLPPGLVAARRGGYMSDFLI